MSIHPTAVIDKSAEVDPTAEIGAYAIVEPGVTIGAECKLYPHAYVSSGTTLGEGCQIHPFAVVGHHPQDLKWARAPSYTIIGAGTVIREGAQVHRGTEPESKTVLGERVYMMATSHVGHNCVIGDDVIITNAGLVAGHVHVGNRAFISGCALLHQFIRVGELCMIAGGARVTNDVPPYMTCGQNGVISTNVVGLRRAGFSSEERREIRIAYKTLFRSGLLFREAVRRVEEAVRTAPGRRIVEFLNAPTLRGYSRYKGGASDGAD